MTWTVDWCENTQLHDVENVVDQEQGEDMVKRITMLAAMLAIVLVVAAAPALAQDQDCDQRGANFAQYNFGRQDVDQDCDQDLTVEGDEGDTIIEGDETAIVGGAVIGSTASPTTVTASAGGGGGGGGSASAGGGGGGSASAGGGGGGSASAASGGALPETGGASLIALGAGALLVAGGLLARRIVR